MKTGHSIEQLLGINSICVCLNGAGLVRSQRPIHGQSLEDLMSAICVVLQPAAMVVQ